MKKTGIRLLVSLILVTMVVVTVTAPVSAAKPVKLGITITDISEGSITVDYWWNKLGARYYEISVYKLGGGGILNSTGLMNLGGRTPTLSSNITFTNANITCDHQYRAFVTLYRRPNKTIRGASIYAQEWFYCPPPPCIFYEDFTGVANYNLPDGWVTNDSSEIFVYDEAGAGGIAPELYFDYGTSNTSIHDYWVHTPAINATATTTALNLTYKHNLHIHDFARNFTYSVEVSNDSGSNWTAVLEETPTLAQYPGYEIGPETVNIDLGAYVGDEILVRWRLRGYTWYSDGWLIDDVCVDGS